MTADGSTAYDRALEGGDWQTETCAGNHGHGRNKPICRTVAILDGAT